MLQRHLRDHGSSESLSLRDNEDSYLNESGLAYPHSPDQGGNRQDWPTHLALGLLGKTKGYRECVID
jgi:hypothetical protein